MCVVGRKRKKDKEEVPIVTGNAFNGLFWGHFDTSLPRKFVVFLSLPLSVCIFGVYWVLLMAYEIDFWLMSNCLPTRTTTTTITMGLEIATTKLKLIFNKLKLSSSCGNKFGNLIGSSFGFFFPSLELVKCVGVL